MATPYGYAGKLLRVDLTSGRLTDEVLDEAVLRRVIGGTALGVKYLYDEVPPQISWLDPANRVIIASGPLGGSKASGSGTVSVIARGAMTNGFASTQANGFLGAHLKSCGYDGVIFQGAAADWTYLHVDDRGAELRDARSLVGKDTWEIQDAVEATFPNRKYSVFGIGPAGEHLVRFAGLIGDRGHAAAHNGVGAVLGSKRLKAVAVARGQHRVPLFDRPALAELTKRCAAQFSSDPKTAIFHQWGTAGHYSSMVRSGLLPVKNYTTNLFPEHEKVNGQYTRTRFQNRKAPCWACQLCCCRMTTVTEGDYAGFKGEEPEYEGYAAFTSLIGNTDPGAMVMLANLVDRLGFDVNEAGFVVSFAMECYERGLIDAYDSDGLALRWGNVAAAAALLKKVAFREGKLGQLFADGVRVAAQRLGGEALDVGVYTLKGNSIRGHDHRANWQELLDTCLSSTGTIECSPGTSRVSSIGVEPIADRFDWQQVATFNAKANGWRHWVDSLGICSFNYDNPEDQLAAVYAVTGWKIHAEEAKTIGRRAANQMRLYNLRCGLNADADRPSRRYASDPVDGPAAGKGAGKHFDDMRRAYYGLMGWDELTGQPKPETLRQLDLKDLLPDLAELPSQSSATL